MTELPKGISVSSVENEIHVRVVGRGTFQNGQPLRRFAVEMIELGRRIFIVDLALCDGMDSTFLGVLAGIGLRLGQAGAGGAVRVVNVGPRNLELLQTLGLDRLFGMEPKAAGTAKYSPPPEAKFSRLPDSDVSHLATPLNRTDTADLMLEAHDNLIRADRRNLAKFKDLTTFLREKIERHEPDTGTPK
jgi:anti-anti-sigma regulatory factor